jgi:hypothetical protein
LEEDKKAVGSWDFSLNLEAEAVLVEEREIKSL